MGEATAISWADATWNPWRGCAKVSPGCANCYMFRDQVRYGNDPSVVVRAARGTFEAPLKWDPSVVFTCSWSDFFIEAADEWRDAAWDIIRRTPQHTYLILTKRLEIAPARLPADWPLPNVWLGTSIENMRHTFRADLLRALPAERRFVSAEPLLGSLIVSPLRERDPKRLRAGESAHERAPRAEGHIDPVAPATSTLLGAVPLSERRTALDLSGIDWLIVGGESGARADARPMHPAWARELRDAALEADVAFHFKQWGSWGPNRGGDVVLSRDGRQGAYASSETADFTEAVLVGYCGSGPDSCGRLLEGREYLDRPEVGVVASPVTTLF